MWPVPTKPGQSREKWFSDSKNIKCLKFKLKNDILLAIITQAFPHKKSIFLLEYPLFLIGLLNVYWAISS